MIELRKIKLMLEKGDGKSVWGWVEDSGNYLPTTVADSIEGVKANILTLVQEHIEEDGEDALPWKKILDEGHEFKVNWYRDTQAIKRLQVRANARIKSVKRINS